MSKPAPDPRTRILTHMNADHHDSLVRYLEHHYSLPSSIARHATLTDVSLSSMLISTRPSASPAKQLSYSYRIPFDPPLTSWGDVRPRVVEMDHAALAALGRDEITIKRYAYPYRAWHWGVLAACVFAFVLLGRGRGALDPGSGGVTAGLKERFPGVFAWLYKIQPLVFWPMVVLHLGEAALMDRTRLRKHSVPRRSAVWWQWMIGTFLEGVGNFVRFDEMVRRERTVREGKKH